MHGRAAVSDKHEKKYRTREYRRETRKELAVGWKSTRNNASDSPLSQLPPNTRNHIIAGQSPKISFQSRRTRSCCCAQAPQRPCGYATKEGDEFAPPHSITSSARNKSDVGMDTPRACAVRMLSTVSNFVGRSIGSAAGSAPRATLPARTPASRYKLSRFGP